MMSSDTPFIDMLPMIASRSRPVFVRCVRGLHLAAALLLMALLSLTSGPTASAQTGPGGVGTDDGSSDLQLWIRADELSGFSDGDLINMWPDASGYNHDATQSNTDRQPIYRSSGRNGRPTAEFGGPNSDNGSFTAADADEMEGTLSSLTSGPATYFAVGNNVAVSPDDGGQGEAGNRGRRALAAFWNDNTDDTDNWLWVEDTEINFYDGSTQIRGGSISEGEFVLYDVTHEGNTIDGRLFGDQVIDETNAASSGTRNTYQLGNDRTRGDNLDGNLAEVIFFDRILNEAERLIVQNYLSSKYDISFTTASNDKYAYDAAYSYDVAGIGEATDGSTQLASSSSIIEFSTTSFSANDQYVFTGHDNADASAFGFESTEPVNGLTSNVERMAREWRADLSGTSSKTVTVSIDGSDLPAKSTSSSEYLLFVDSGDAFSNPATYTLVDNGSGTFEADITLADGDYITVGAGQRIVAFSPTTASAFENTTASPNGSFTVELNLPYSSASGTDVDVAFTDSGTGTYPASSADYSVDTASPVTIPAGSETASVDITLDNDGDFEQTETFEVTLEASGTTNASLGAASTATFSILDDDDPRKLSFATPSVSQPEGNGGGTRTETFTVEMPPSEEAATTAPLTTVDFEITGASTATVGDDITIVDESDPGSGAEYQERLSATTGRIHFSSASNTTAADLKLEISEDDISEDDEDVVIQLFNPVSSALALPASSESTELTFTLTNDDNAPTVQFATGASQGNESTNGTIDVTLSETAGNTVSVDFVLDSGASTATDGSDFDLLPSGGTITFDPGSVSASITVDAIDDSQPEFSEDVVIDLQSPSNATLGTQQSHTYTILDNDDPIGSTGPGGVGRTDGTGALVLWMNADNITGLNDNDPVETWLDASGYGNDASQSSPAARPVYKSSGRNGIPTVEFGGPDSGTFDATADVMSGSINPSSDNVVTYFAAGNNDAMTAPGSGNGGSDDRRALAAFEGASAAGWLFAVQDDNVRFYDGSTVLNGSSSISGGEFVVFDVEHSGSNVDGQLNGSSAISSSSADPSGSISDYLLGDDFTGGDNLDGNLGDVIVFDAVLNTTQRTIVQNYLSAKYDVALTGTDIYEGDTNGNGDYDLGVFGVGQESTSDFHPAAETDGLRFEVQSGGLTDGDYLLAGYSEPDNQVNSSDIGGVSGLEARMERDWFWDGNEGSPTVDVTFDLSKAGFPSVLNPDASGYVLLYRSGQTGNWSDVSSSATVDNVDQITFAGVSAGTNGYYTLGTTDAANSPISGTAITITGTAGNEGLAADGSLGGDAGWRMVGPPVSGTNVNVENIVSDVRDPFIFNQITQGDQLFRWDDENGQWEVLRNGSDPFDSGRGHILFLFDDDEGPIDPTLTIDVNTGTVPTTNQTVSVDQGAQWHLLANPFNQDYDLNALENNSGTVVSGGGTGFNTTVQIWDGGSTSGERGSTQGSYKMIDIGSAPAELAPTGRYISAWQGFFVERTNPGSGDTELTFNTSGRVGDDSRDIVGSNAEGPGSALSARMAFALTVDDGSGTQIARDEAASIKWHENATDEWDAFDATKLTPFSSSYATIGPVGTVRDGSTAVKAQESQPLPDAEDPFTVSLDLEISGNVAGDATLRAAQWQGIPDTWELTLIDTKGTADSSDDEAVAWTDGAEYTFILGDSEANAQATARASEGARTAPPSPTALEAERPASMQQYTRANSSIATPDAQAQASGASSSNEGSPPRFVLEVDPAGAPLPVELQELTVQQREQRARLQWTTASETNNAGFYVQTQALSEDSTTTASAWTDLGFVEGRGTTDTPQSYQFETDEMEYGAHAFRLRQVDTDGTETTTEPVTVEVQLDQTYAIESPYPNPSRQQASLPVTVRETQRVQVILYDMLGRRIATVHDGEMRGQDTQTIRLNTGQLASGTYFVRVRGEGFVATERVTVVR